MLLLDSAATSPAQRVPCLQNTETINQINRNLSTSAEVGYSQLISTTRLRYKVRMIALRGPYELTTKNSFASL